MVVVKLIGAVYKLPLNNILGSVGKTYFDTAYLIYNFLNIFATAGLPLAISKLTSQAHAQGRENEKRKIFRTAIWLFFALGPAVFCVCLLACMRGYTQGQGNMTPTAVSQVLEALCKVGIGLPLAWYILRLSQSAVQAAATEEAGRLKGVEEVEIYKKAGDAVHGTKSSSDRLGHVITVGATPEEAMEIGQRAMGLITVEWEPSDSLAAGKGTGE